jgi:hypothetical protein
MYVCTDATAGENVWTNVGEGTGDITPYAYPGESKGFAFGGAQGRGTTIDYFSFTSDGNASDWGDLVTNRQRTAGQNSPTHGYSTKAAIDKWAFASAGNASQIGTCQYTSDSAGGQSSTTNGYYTSQHRREKFSFSSDGNSSDVADASTSTVGHAGCSSATDGFSIRGGFTNGIDKFSFSTDVTASDHGDLDYSPYTPAGGSSLTYGYSMAGDGNAVGSWKMTNVCKFAFSSNTTGTDVGDLGVGRGSDPAGASSTNHVYCMGGDNGNGSHRNEIEKVSTTTGGNSTDVGDLTVARYGVEGNHV